MFDPYFFLILFNDYFSFFGCFVVVIAAFIGHCVFHLCFLGQFFAKLEGDYAFLIGFSNNDFFAFNLFTG